MAAVEGLCRWPIQSWGVTGAQQLEGWNDPLDQFSGLFIVLALCIKGCW